jgi:predicted nucleic acid-binding protein
MLSRWVVDTSWLYALFDSADEHHARALKQAGRPGHYEVPSEILAETLALRFARAPGDKHRSARDMLASILEAGFHVIGNADPLPAMQLYQSKRGLSFPDCIAVVHALDAQLLTFDRSQATAWRGLSKK